MASEHEYWEEQSESYAMGLLQGEAQSDFEAHVKTGCALCDAHVRETREALNLLHRSLSPISPPATAKARLFQQLDLDKTSSVPTAVRRTPRRWQRMTGTIAAGIIGLVIGGAYYHFQYEPRHSLYTSVVNLLRDPATRDYPLYGAWPTPQAKGRFLWNASGEGHIFVTNLPAAPTGKMYAVWTIAQRAAPRYVGTIRTDAVGQGGLHINTERSAAPIDTFAVTLEPDGTTAAPTGPIVLVSKQS
jgi:anti-sigma-K factor RskA